MQRDRYSDEKFRYIFKGIEVYKLSIEKGVSLLGLKPEMIIGIMIVRDAFLEVGYNCIILPCSEPDIPKIQSMHSCGCAIDFSTTHIEDKDDIGKIINIIFDNFGSEFMAKKYDTHIHVEWRPR